MRKIETAESLALVVNEMDTIIIAGSKVPLAEGSLWSLCSY
jgi:hypothetical protein